LFKEFGFCSFSVKEALHLSEKEEKTNIELLLEKAKKCLIKLIFTLPR